MQPISYCSKYIDVVVLVQQKLVINGSDFGFLVIWEGGVMVGSILRETLVAWNTECLEDPVSRCHTSVVGLVSKPQESHILYRIHS